jgi:hypothetical protein
VEEQATAAAEALAYLQRQSEETAIEVDFKGWIKDLELLEEAAGNAADALMGLKRSAEEAAEAADVANHLARRRQGRDG